MERRDFIKTLGIIGGTALTGKKLHGEEKAASENKEFVGILVDTTRCAGCQSCSEACAEAHGLPEPDDVLAPLIEDDVAHTGGDVPGPDEEGLELPSQLGHEGPLGAVAHAQAGPLEEGEGLLGEASLVRKCDAKHGLVSCLVSPAEAPLRGRVGAGLRVPSPRGCRARKRPRPVGSSDGPRPQLLVDSDPDQTQASTAAEPVGAPW